MKGIQGAYKGTAMDLAVLCDNLSEIPVSLHAKAANMFVSNPNALCDGCGEKLKLMDQSLRGILRVGHTSIVDDCFCQLTSTLSRHWNRKLDCAESILDARPRWIQPGS